MQPHQVHGLSRPVSHSPSCRFPAPTGKNCPIVLPDREENLLLGRAAEMREGQRGCHSQQMASAPIIPFTGGSWVTKFQIFPISPII